MSFDSDAKLKKALLSDRSLSANFTKEPAYPDVDVEDLSEDLERLSQNLSAVAEHLTDEGVVGADGKSAYQIAVDNGFVGTEDAWLLSLKGIPGDKPDHEWSGTSLRFKNPNGSWGSYVNLKGVDGTGGVKNLVDTRDYSNNIAAALATGKDVYVPAGDYPITSTLVVGPGQKLILSQGTRILINANVDGVRVRHKGWLTGGIVQVNTATWDKATVLLDGSEPVDVYGTGVSDITLMNGDFLGKYPLQGSGLLLRAMNDNEYVMHANFNNINILFFEKCVHLLAPRATHAWINQFINANNFVNIMVKGKYGLYLDGGAANQWQVAGNFFENIQMQLTANSVSAIYCNGMANRFKAFAFDSFVMSDESKVIHFPAGITGTATEQYTVPSDNIVEVQYGFNHAHVTDLGVNNFITGTPDVFPNQRSGAGGVKIWTGTEAQYAAITVKDPNTLYFRTA